MPLIQPLNNQLSSVECQASCAVSCLASHGLDWGSALWGKGGGSQAKATGCRQGVAEAQALASRATAEAKEGVTAMSPAVPCLQSVCITTAHQGLCAHRDGSPLLNHSSMLCLRGRLILRTSQQAINPVSREHLSVVAPGWYCTALLAVGK